MLAAEDHLESDEAFQVRIPGLVDDAHAAAAELLQAARTRRMIAAARRLQTEKLEVGYGEAVEETDPTCVHELGDVDELPQFVDEIGM